MLLALCAACEIAQIAAAAPPEINYNAPIHISQAVITAADVSTPRASITVTDPETGKRLTFGGLTTNTLTRNGLTRDHMIGQTIGFDGYYYRDVACERACTVRLHSLTFADGSKIFLGTAGVAAATTPASTTSR